jgi:hypothetical protein
MVGNFRHIRIAAAGLSLLAAGCNEQNIRPSNDKPGLPNGYTCCNFHYEKDWINDGNYAQLPMLPAGSRIRVIDYGRYRASVEIDGKPFRLGLDYGRTAETTEQWVAKLVVDSNPAEKLATYPRHVREAIQRGQIMLGMSKEQVIMSLGYPLTSENPRLDAPLWRYWWSSFGEYRVHWNGDLVSKVTGHPETLDLMLAPGLAGPAATTAAPAARQPAKRQDAKKRANPAATGGNP